MSRVVLVAGLGFGDEGKGSIVDYLARTTEVGDSYSSVVVRYSGGGQAAHNVVTPSGRHHTFAQFGSATFAGGATHLSRYMMVNPFSMINEANSLMNSYGINPFETTTIERDALVTNMYQIAANRIRENMRGDGRHGSCGMGIGETMADSLDYPDDAIRVRDLLDPSTLRAKLTISRDRKLEELSPHIKESEVFTKIFSNDNLQDYLTDYLEFARYGFKIVGPEYLKQRLAERRTIIFEGAQGALLDQDFGFHPHTTWSDTTFGNAYKLLHGYEGECHRMGLLRGYHTRHGAGPMPSEASNHDIKKDEHNLFGTYQEGFRIGHFDTLLARYALNVVGGVDSLCITNLDKLGIRPKICVSYRMQDGTFMDEIPVQKAPVNLTRQEQLTERLKTVYNTVGVVLESPQDLIHQISDTLAPVTLVSTGPTADDKMPVESYMDTATPPKTGFFGGLWN